MNNHKYYFISNTPYLSFLDTLEWFRFDSANGNLLTFKPGSQCRIGNEELVDSLASDTNTIAKVCSNTELFRKCYTAGNMTLFNQQVYSKFFDFVGIVNYGNKRYAKKFGVAYSYSVEPLQYDITLVGCVIDGIVYGDTTIIGIQPISTMIPNTFSLHQNYPNPFNPTTRIKFDIPPSPRGEGGRGVRLVIYDLLGREVAILVNEPLKPGTYEVEFPAPSGDGNSFASGVYFYSLITSEFTETKKLILLK